MHVVAAASNRDASTNAKPLARAIKLGAAVQTQGDASIQIQASPHVRHVGGPPKRGATAGRRQAERWIRVWMDGRVVDRSQGERRSPAGLPASIPDSRGLPACICLASSPVGQRTTSSEVQFRATTPQTQNCTVVLPRHEANTTRGKWPGGGGDRPRLAERTRPPRIDHRCRLLASLI